MNTDRFMHFERLTKVSTAIDVDPIDLVKFCKENRINLCVAIPENIEIFDVDDEQFLSGKPMQRYSSVHGGPIFGLSFLALSSDDCLAIMKARGVLVASSGRFLYGWKIDDAMQLSQVFPLRKKEVNRDNQNAALIGFYRSFATFLRRDSKPILGAVNLTVEIGEKSKIKLEIDKLIILTNQIVNIYENLQSLEFKHLANDPTFNKLCKSLGLPILDSAFDLKEDRSSLSLGNPNQSQGKQAHSTVTKRTRSGDEFSPILKFAIRNAEDPDDNKSVWMQILKMASVEQPKSPLIRVDTLNGKKIVVFQKDDKEATLTMRNLSERLKRYREKFSK
jgi:hypothetical protein